MKNLADSNLPLNLARLGYIHKNNPSDIKSHLALARVLAKTSIDSSIKPFTVSAKKIPHHALLLESDSDYLFGFNTTHTDIIKGVECIPFNHVQKTVQNQFFLENKSPYFIPRSSYLAACFFSKNTVEACRTFQIGHSMGLNRDLEYKKIFNLTLNHLRFSMMDNIINNKCNHILLNDEASKSKKIILDYDAKKYIGDKAFNVLFPEIFTDDSVFDDLYIREGLTLYVKIINTSYLWQLNVHGNEGLTGYDNEGNVLLDIIGGNF